MKSQSKHEMKLAMTMTMVKRLAPNLHFLSKRGSLPPRIGFVVDGETESGS